MRVGRMVFASMFLWGCNSDRAPDVAAGKVGRPVTDAAIAATQPLVGCYVLNTGGPAPYRLHLAPGGDAYLIGPNAEGNRPGDEWTWSASTDSTFSVAWAGIDSWMKFSVARHAGQWLADGGVTTANGETELPTTIERVECPLPMPNAR